MDFKYIKRNKGITIIALTVTIIVMLILASISINVVIGDGGWLDQMKDTSERTDNVINTDESHLNVLYNELDNSLSSSFLSTSSDDVIFGSPRWNDGKASVSISTNSDYELQYQRNGLTSENWQTIESGTSITDLQNNDIIYVRLTDGSKYSTNYNLTIEDKTPPIVNITTSSKSTNSIILTVTASDNESGLSTSNTYQYYLDGILKTTSQSNIYTYTSISTNASHSFMVIVTDAAGNTTQKYITVDF